MSDPQQLYRKALDRFRSRQYLDAAGLAQQALALDPRLVNAWRLLADIHGAQGRPDLAVECLRSAQACAAPESPQQVSVDLHLAEMLIRSGNQGEALVVLDRQRWADIAHLQPLAQAAYLYSLCEAHDESRELFERALVLDPENPQLLFNCAAANRAMGDLARAEALYDRLIALNPADSEAYKNRSDLRRQTPEENHIRELEQRVRDAKLPAADLSQLHFALAKEYEDLGEHEKSFDALARACRLRREQIDYKPQQELQRLREIAEVYTREFLSNSAQGEKAQGEGVIFVLGMPRTGTTLVDRLLCAAPGVYSAGEPGIFARELSALVRESASGDGGISGFVRASAAVDFQELGRRYCAELRQRVRARDAEVILDKNPLNFLYIGLIHKALPRAKIVHLCRNPMDSCYAILKTQFRNAYAFSYDQQELGNYYLAYRQLMAHWRQALPGAICDIQYEDLVTDLAGESRRLFDFCGLEWSPAVLDFHTQQKQGTATASAAQVRQPVYNSSIGKWKNYREQLQPLADTLRAGGLEIA